VFFQVENQLRLSDFEG